MENLREIEEDTLEIDPHKYGQLILDEGTKTIQWRLASLFNNDARTIPHTKQKHKPTQFISHISYKNELKKIFVTMGYAEVYV